MALSGDTMGTLVAGAINGLSSEDKKDLTKVWQTICTQIVAHITTSGQVTGTVTGVTATGSPGGPLPIVSQPVVGNIV